MMNAMITKMIFKKMKKYFDLAQSAAAILS